MPPILRLSPYPPPKAAPLEVLAYGRHDRRGRPLLSREPMNPACRREVIDALSLALALISHPTGLYFAAQQLAPTSRNLYIVKRCVAHVLSTHSWIVIVDRRLNSDTVCRHLRSPLERYNHHAAHTLYINYWVSRTVVTRRPSSDVLHFTRLRKLSKEYSGEETPEDLVAQAAYFRHQYVLATGLAQAVVHALPVQVHVLLGEINMEPNPVPRPIQDSHYPVNYGNVWEVGMNGRLVVGAWDKPPSRPASANDLPALQQREMQSANENNQNAGDVGGRSESHKLEGLIVRAEAGTRQIDQEWIKNLCERVHRRKRHPFSTCYSGGGQIRGIIQRNSLKRIVRASTLSFDTTMRPRPNTLPWADTFFNTLLPPPSYLSTTS
ncbi:unnamed protein product [Cutaneotrichosporon oleaginosum]